MDCARVGLAAARSSSYSAAGGFGGEICAECARFRARDFFDAFIKWSCRVDWRGAAFEFSRELAGEFLRELVSDFMGKKSERCRRNGVEMWRDVEEMLRVY